jgi:hypothetical protein
MEKEINRKTRKPFFQQLEEDEEKRQSRQEGKDGDHRKDQSILGPSPVFPGI